MPLVTASHRPALFFEHTWACPVFYYFLSLTHGDTLQRG